MCRFGSRCSRKNPSHFDDENHPDDHPLFGPAPGDADTPAAAPCVYNPAPGMPMCRFGSRCKRKNPAHFDEENHPDDHPFFSPSPSAAADGAGHAGQKRQAAAVPLDSPKRPAAAPDADPPSPPFPSPVPLSPTVGGGGAADLRNHFGSAPPAAQPAAAAAAFAAAPPSSSSPTTSAAFTAALPSSYSRDAWRPLLLQAFLTPFSDDFFILHELCASLRPDNPLGALAAGGLAPLAPFRLLSGDASAASPTADRGLHDAAEFQPLLAIGPLSDGRALGYWRDEPGELPGLVVERKPLPRESAPGAAHFGPGVSYSVVGDSLLGAVKKKLVEEAKAGRLRSAEAGRLAERVAAAAAGAGLRHDAEGETTPAAKARKRAGQSGGKKGFKWVETSSKIGLVIPYDRESELGYRRLHLGGKELRKLLARIVKSPKEERTQHQSELDELVNWSNISNDESDFGAGLQLGADLLNHDVTFASAAAQQLSTAYSLIGRHAFAEIARRHAVVRRAAAAAAVAR